MPIAGLERLYDEFALCQDEVEILRDWEVGLVRVIPSCASASQAVYLSIGASLHFKKLVSIRLPWGERVTGWPLWSTVRQVPFVLGFKWDSGWGFTGYTACRAESFVANFAYNQFSRREKAWAWVGYAATALSESHLKAGVPILNERFKTSYHFAGPVGTVEQLKVPF